MGVTVAACKFGPVLFMGVCKKRAGLAAVMIFIECIARNHC